MAGKNETPRQKMISMMYLVLTAMLALNVTREVLDSFVVIDKGLEATNKNFEKRNDELYAQFDLAKNVDPNRVKSNWEKAQLVKKEAANLNAYIDQIKNELISKTEGVSEQVADTLQMERIESKDNTDVSTFIMIGNKEDGSNGKSRELKNKLQAYKKMLDEYILPADRKKVEINLDTQDPPPNDENANWEVYNFSERPLVACITLLSKFKNDIKTAESNVVDYLLKQVDKGSLKFDTVAAKVIPQSNYVLLGEEYKADVFLAAFNKTRNPEIRIGNFDEKTKAFIGSSDALNVERGLGKYNVKTTREGMMSYAGSIKVVAPSGEEMMFPFKSDYIVAKPALTVSAEAMNVFYAGLDNPVSISVPGIPNERLAVSISNGKIASKGNGKFMVKVMSGTEAKISVTAAMENGEKRNMGISTFRIRRVPKPTVKYAGLVADGTLTRSEMENASGVLANYENFVFDVPCKVLSCTVSFISSAGVEDYDLKSNIFTEPLRLRIKRVRRGERMMITNVKVSDPTGGAVTASGLTVKVR